MFEKVLDILDACGYDTFLVLKHINIYLEEGKVDLAKGLLLYLAGYVKGEMDFSALIGNRSLAKMVYKMEKRLLAEEHYENI